MGRASADDRRKQGRVPATRRARGRADRAPGATVGVDEALRWLERHGKRSTIEGMARYGIPSEGAYGVTSGELRGYARPLVATTTSPPPPGRRAGTRPGFWPPWWAICDTVCFHLFDRTPHAWSRVRAWSRSRALFVKRAAFAVLWGLTVHDRAAADRAFLDCRPLIETGALDERDLVKKAVDMSLRALGSGTRPCDGPRWSWRVGWRGRRKARRPGSDGALSGSWPADAAERLRRCPP
jgi:DNA alkylation repair enzyme